MSPVDICNRALQMLGAKTISSLTQDSPNARACAVAYPSIRDAELQANAWSFAIQRETLPALSTAPAFGFSYGYALPADFLRSLPPDARYSSPVDWVVEGTTLLTNVSGGVLQLRYISRVTDTNRMTPLFIEALAARLAVELCETITQSNTKAAALSEMYKAKINQARQVNAIQKLPIEPAVDSWLRVRR